MRSILFPVALATLTPSLAFACGGFFCNPLDPETGLPIEPIVQSGERVLFEVHDDGTITTVVEIQYQGDPVDFAWVLPLPHAIAPEDVGVAPAGLFDELEALTAPTFELGAAGADYASVEAAGLSMGCGGLWPGRRGRGVDDGVDFDPWAGVEVVGEAVVGPYAVEIIQADNPGNLGNWLVGNGYSIPSEAFDAIAWYVASGGAFLGLKLRPDVAEGPIDALRFTYAGERPMLPLRLTAVAAVPDMEVVTYVLADQRYATQGWSEVPFDHGQVQWNGGQTDYVAALGRTLDAAGGRAFHTEFAGGTEALLGAASISADLLAGAPYLTRLRSFASPQEMTLDPEWAPAPELGDVGKHHIIGEDVITASAPAALGLLGLAWGLLLRRRSWRLAGAGPRCDCR